MIKIAISGAMGRMGQTLYKTLISSDDFEIVYGIDVVPNTGNALPYPVFTSYESIKTNLFPIDLIIDFSSPKATDGVLDFCLANNISVLIASTGHTQDQLAKINEAAKHIAIFKTANLSLGVNLLSNLSKDAAKFLGDSYEVEIIEQHHNQKLDAPSGTAIMLANAINEAHDNNLEFVYGRHGASAKRKPNELGIHAIRGGSIAGKHDVLFIGNGEVITLAHESASKEVFAVGALRAARFLATKKTGLYDMNSILGDSYAVTTVIGEDGISLFSIPSIDPVKFVSILEQLAKSDVNLDMISQTANGIVVTVGFTVGQNDTATTAQILESNNVVFSMLEGKAKLTTEGAGMVHRSGVAMEVLKTLQEVGTPIHAITTSETKISCCIDNNFMQESILKLRSYFEV